MKNRDGLSAPRLRGLVRAWASLGLALWVLAAPKVYAGETEMMLAPGAIVPAVSQTQHGRAPAADPWQACLTAAESIEREERLPEQILAAVTTVETGWSKPGAGTTRYPWPWTVTAQGRGRHFPTKEAAIESVRALIAAGVNSIDVGCMQINLFYHPRAFTGLEEAFDPSANMRYAVSFLRRLKETFGTWDSALEHYHSYDPERRQDYRGKIFAAWTNVQARREQLRLASGISTAPLGAETRLAESSSDVAPMLGDRAGRADRSLPVGLPGAWQTPTPVLAASADLAVPVDTRAPDRQKRKSSLGPRVVIPVDLSPRASDRFDVRLNSAVLGGDDRLAPTIPVALAARPVAPRDAPPVTYSE